MESRRVVLLTKGYLQGRLDFKYKNPLSRHRENYIVNQIEQEELHKIYSVRSLFDVVLGTALKSEDTIRASFDSYKVLVESVLPYSAKTNTIDIKSNKDTLIEIRKRLKLAKKASRKKKTRK